MISAQQDDAIKKVLRDLAMLAALLPDESEQQNAIIEAVGLVARAASIQKKAAP